MKDWKKPEDWYSIDLETRKQWYFKLGEAYDRTRPSYDSNLIKRIIELSHFTPQSHLLELGSGTGKATIEFARFHLSLLGLEPNSDFYALAQKNSLIYPNISLLLTSFEEWQPRGHLFDGVIAANSFHWIPPEVSYQKSYQSLKDKGYLILLWNLSLQPSWEIYQKIKPVYQKIVPALDKYETLNEQKEVVNQFGKLVRESNLFTIITTEETICQVNYSVEDYLTLLGTYSPYIALNSQRRLYLFSELKEKLLTLTNGILSLTYLCAAQIAQKIPK